MKVLVVGAGIGGLGAATALKRAGHDVEVFENSSFLHEVGAAIHLAPNATHVLKSWECDLEALAPVQCEGIRLYNRHLDPVGQAVTYEEGKKAIGCTDPWLHVHRVDLHVGLRELAEKPYQGRSVKIHLKSKVDSVNAETGEIHLVDGRTVKGDLVIGADGLHSYTVGAIVENGRDKIGLGQRIFRFLIPTAKAQANPAVKKLLDTIGMHQTSAIGDSINRLIIYPCRSGELLNCGFLHTGDDDVGAESSWLNPGSLDNLMEKVVGFDESVVEFCKMAEDLKLWSLMTRDPPPSFVKGRLALLGDAAHPMLPHQGQGGAQAIEDASALGAAFPADTKPEEVPEMLEIYNKVRYDHTVSICILSRVAFERRAEQLDELKKYVPNATLEGHNHYAHWNSFPAAEIERLLAERRAAKA